LISQYRLDFSKKVASYFLILLFDAKLKRFVTPMPVFSFKTIQFPSEGQFKDKGSRFLAFAYPVISELEIKEKLNALRKEYFDARHHCFAWTLGAEKRQFRASDDGEPNHSAGDPILGQIRSRELTNALVVVVRYFGGVKLGVSGLINAYKTAAEEALNNATIIETDVTEKMKLNYDYQATPELMRLVKDFNLSIQSQSFNERCEMSIEYKLILKEELIEKINLLKATGTAIDWQPT
jgi:uncharacterized YigZ family protein